MDDTHAQQPVQPRKPTRHRILITVIVLLVVIVAGIFLSVLIRQDRDHQRRVEALRHLRSKGASWFQENTLLDELHLGLDKRGEVLNLYLDKPAIVDNDLVHLQLFPELESVTLDGSAVTDAGMSHLASLTALKNLNLSNTAVTDAGLATLKSLPNLEGMALMNTAVTDEGLEHLASMPALTDVILSGCIGITEDGIARFRPLCTQFIRLHR